MGGKSPQEIIFRITSLLGTTSISKPNLYQNSYYLLALNKFFIFSVAGSKLEAILHAGLPESMTYFPAALRTDAASLNNLMGL